MAERRGQVAVKDLPPKLQKKLRRQKIMPKKARKLNRSMAGNALLLKRAKVDLLRPPPGPAVPPPAGAHGH